MQATAVNYSAKIAGLEMTKKVEPAVADATVCTALTNNGKAFLLQALTEHEKGKRESYSVLFNRTFNAAKHGGCDVGKMEAEIYASLDGNKATEYQVESWEVQ